MMLQAEHITVRAGNSDIVSDVSFSLEAGQWLMLLGPNGAGKSTLLRAVSQAVRHQGSVLLHGKDIRSFRPRELARHIGVMSQDSGVHGEFTVEEIVSLGRYAHRGMLTPQQTDTERLVMEALGTVGLSDKRYQRIQTLSGGERQRAFLAQVLCQDPDILMLDEPGNHLDLVYHKQLLDVIDNWRQQSGKAVISVVHDLSIARKYGTHALLMENGRTAAYDTVFAATQPETLRRVWGMDVAAWLRELTDCWTENA